MRHLNPKLVVGAVAVTIAAVVAVALLALNREPQVDRDFDSRVADPAYRGGGPVILFDEGHLNTHTAAEGYKPLADILRNDGYTLRVSREPLEARALEGVSILMLVLAKGANDANDDPAYSETEEAVIEEWVRAGGSLFLIGDHWPFGSAVRSLARRFDVTMGEGLVQDSTHCDPDRGDSHLVFSVENGLLQDHPIVRGRSQKEQVRKVLTFTGTSLQGPAGAAPFLLLSEAATERPPGPPRVTRDGGDVRVAMEYGDPVAAASRTQGLALEVGSGRVVVLAEAGMLRAQRERNGLLVGMNVPGYDNRQLGLNIAHWLSRIL
jgi:hypothetical protein